jgi:peptidoglycan/xylan/chitin deacetylase (PgdA/CDA1 family)
MAQVMRRQICKLLLILVLTAVFFSRPVMAEGEKTHEGTAPTTPLSRPNVVVPILMYHRVGDTTPNEYWISADEFSAQMKALVENGFQAVSTRDLYAYMYEGGSLPTKPVIITFDDAGEDLYTHAWPILKREGLFAESFVVTDAIGTSESDRKSSTRFGEPGAAGVASHLIWPEIVEMLSEGMVFGSHSKSHQDLTEVSDTELAIEIRRSKEVLFSEAGIVATSFAYPYGAGDDHPRIQQMLAKHGYTTALGVDGGVEQTQSANPLDLNRIYIYGPQPRRYPGSSGISVTPDAARPEDSFLGKIMPEEAELYYLQSHSYAVADRPNLAFAAIEQAVELEPDNIEYLKAHSVIANWVGRSDRAADSYKAIVSYEPDNKSALLNLARSNSWAGRLDRAASAYERYLSRYPDEPAPYIESAQNEAWRGNYSKSLERLEQYRERFGETKEYLQEKARVLAWARRPERAFEIIRPLLDEEPDDYEVNCSRTIALHYDNRPREALESLDTLVQLRPESEDNEDIRRFVVTPLRSYAEFGSRFYTDTDDLDHYTGWVRGIYIPRPETRLGLGYEIDYMDADDEDSGLQPFDGDEDAWHHRGWFEMANRFSPEVAVDGYAGIADTEGKTRPTYGIGLDYQPKDNLALRLERDYGFYVVSPRTLDLGIRRGRNNFAMDWEPNLLWTVVGSAGYSDYSDDNDSWEAVFAPRRSVLRSSKLNLDLGVRGLWFGFDDDLDNGYYDPELYESYMVTSFWYWKISDNDGVSFTADIGAIKDDEMSKYKFGWGSSVEGTFGIYRDVMLKIGGSAFNSRRQGESTFEAYSAHIILTFRF